jgi:hypothetical protein
MFVGGIAIGGQAGEEGLQVAADAWVGVFAEDQGGAGVDQEEIAQAITDSGVTHE